MVNSLMNIDEGAYLLYDQLLHQTPSSTHDVTLSADIPV